MIQARVEKQDGRYIGFSCAGHAGYAPSGEDVVCAAVSILVINTVNAIEAFCHQQMQVQTDPASGEITVRFGTTVTEKTTLLMDAFVLGMTGILEQYEKYVTFTIEEVAVC